MDMFTVLVGGGGMTRLSSMERSICECEITHIVQIDYTKSVNFHAGGGDAFPYPPAAIPAFLLL